MSGFDDIMAGGPADVMEDQLGETVSYSHNGGAAVDVGLVLFRESMRDYRNYDDGFGDTYEAEVAVRVDDIGGVPVANVDSIVRDSVTWICRTVDDVSGGIATCRFGRFVNIERSKQGYRRQR